VAADTVSDGPEWVRTNRSAIESALVSTADPYPCHFGAGAQLRTENVYVSAPVTPSGLDDSAVRTIGAALTDFLHGAGVAHGRRRPTLLCALGPPSASGSLAADQRLFWDLLSRLPARDGSGWPPGVPADPADPGWSFCFAGQQLFVFALSPHYRHRRSRAIATTLTVCFQSSGVFHGISGSTDSGRQAKALVRSRLAAYESAPLIPALGDGTGSTVDKWQQYFPDDDGANRTSRCPVAPPAGWAAPAGPDEVETPS
jgi:uncharacterized protein